MRILFVESDKDLRDFYGPKLSDEFKGTVDMVATGKEAIKLLKTQRPYDVIVSDYYLTKGTGLDILRFKIKNNVLGTFIFFSSKRPEIPYPQDQVHQVNKFSIWDLCYKIKDIKMNESSLRLNLDYP